MEKSSVLQTTYQLTKDLESVMEGRMREAMLPLLTMPELSKKIHGLQKKKMTIIGARTSHAKTSFALQIAHDIASQGKEVLFLSLEMDKVDMLERLFCNIMKIDNYDLLTGKFKGNYENKWREFVEKTKIMPLVFSDCIGKTWQEINDIISNFKIKPQVVILDYIQATKGYGSTAKDKMDDYLLNFRKMAIEHNFAGLICSQVNRSNENEKNSFPQLHQLKGSGVLEEHADIVILLYWQYKTTEEDVDKNVFWFSVAKNRNGRTGSVKISFTPEFYLFEDLNEFKLPERTSPAKVLDYVKFED